MRKCDRRPVRLLRPFQSRSLARRRSTVADFRFALRAAISRSAMSCGVLPQIVHPVTSGVASRAVAIGRTE
jgi:hypothetical protein